MILERNLPVKTRPRVPERKTRRRGRRFHDSHEPKTSILRAVVAVCWNCDRADLSEADVIPVAAALARANIVRPT